MSASTPDHPAARGLSLAPLRGLRFTAPSERLGRLLCPPYDVIDEAARAALLASDADNAVQVVLPRSTTAQDPYQQAEQTIERWLDDGLVAVDAIAALYVYQMRTPATSSVPASVTRGLLGAVELRDPEDGVILPHENTMAGPVADRLALMDATNANLEPIYLVYDGGGAASAAVASVDSEPTGIQSSLPASIAIATTPDGIEHRLWAITDQTVLTAIEQDLDARHALIADGHHRYATYRQLAAQRHHALGAGPWDRGLALLVDSSAYGPQVHPIHRVIPEFDFESATAQARSTFKVEIVADLNAGLTALADRSARPGFTVLVTDGTGAALITEPAAERIASARRDDEPAALLELDVSVLHRVLIERAWNLIDDEHHVLYAHDVADAMESAAKNDGIAIVLRATPVDSVAAVAAAGARMPRKSTLFTPKPASGMVMRRFVDQVAGQVEGHVQ